VSAIGHRDRRQVAGCLRAEDAVGLEHLPGVRAMPGDRPADDLGADGHELVFEGRDDAEVAAAAAQGPEEVGVLGVGDAQHLGRCGDHFHRHQVVAGPAVLAGQIAEAAAHRQPGNPGGRHEPEHGRQAVQLRLPIDVAERTAGLRLGDTTGRIDPHPAQQRHVDHQAAFADRQPGDVVAATAHRAEQAVLPGEAHGLHHVGGAGAARDQTRAAIDHRVPDLAHLLVARVGRGEHRALERRLERLQGLCSDVCRRAVEACELDRHRGVS
jgi:hypothetical protein